MPDSQSTINLLSGSVQTFTDAVSSSNLNDNYRFYLRTRSSLSATLTGLTADANLQLLNSSGGLIQASTNLNQTSEAIQADLVPGVYNLRVSFQGTSGTANYALGVSAANTLQTDLAWRYYGPGGNNPTAIWYLDSTGNVTASPYTSFAVNEPNWAISGTGDFNADGQADLVWRYQGPGGNNPVQIWYMDGNNAVSSTSIVGVSGSFFTDANWHIDAVGDVNNDGQLDLVWRYYGPAGNNPTLVWFMNGNTVTNSAQFFAVDDPKWQIQAVGDFNNDSNLDVIWRYQGPSGNNPTDIWYLKGSEVLSTARLFTVNDANWRICGAADFNQDGRPDVMWRYYGPPGGNPTDIWYMDSNGGVSTSVRLFNVPDPNWQVLPLITTLRPPSQDVAGNSLNQAFAVNTLKGTALYKGGLSSSDTDDYYKFDLTGTSNFSVVLDGLTADADIQLIQDTNGNGSVDNGEVKASGTLSSTNAELITQSLGLGTYYVRVYLKSPASASTSYNLMLDSFSGYSAQVLGNIPAALDESSGLVRGSGDFWWSHNDSGNSATLYAMDNTGTVIGSVPVKGATNVDWEDITAGVAPDGSGRYVLIGDIGNNNQAAVGSRTDQKIYVVQEPASNAADVSLVTTLPIKYPTGTNYDAEALIYDAQTQQVVIITKDWSLTGQSKVFTRSINPADPPDLTLVGTLDLSGYPAGAFGGANRLVTGAALSEDGRVLLVRTYQSVFRWVRRPGESWSSLLSRSPQVISLGTTDPQGEAIAFGQNNSDFYTTSELNAQQPSIQPKFIRYTAI